MTTEHHHTAPSPLTTHPLQTHDILYATLSHLVRIRTCVKRCDARMHTTLLRPHLKHLPQKQIYVHLSFLQEGVIIVLLQPQGRRLCIWLTLRREVR